LRENKEKGKNHFLETIGYFYKNETEYILKEIWWFLYKNKN